MFETHSFIDPNKSDEVLVEELGLKTPPFLKEGDPSFELKPPQHLALHFGARTKRFILSGDKGWGKTIVYMLLALNSGCTRILILCTKNAMLRQKEEIERRFPMWKGHVSFVRGTPVQREKAWNDMHAKVFITTYATLQTDCGVHAKSSKRLAPDWVTNSKRPQKSVFVICDEYHRVLRNKGSKTHTLLKSLDFEYLVLSSGSAANKGPHSMWVALNLCDPKFWSSYWKYVNAYCEVNDGPFGKVIGGVKNVAGWRRAISPYVFHRKKDAKYYPPKTRQLLTVEMEPWQRKIHDDLQKELIHFLEGSDQILVARNKLEATIKIRQLLICPKFLDPSLGYGAGLEGILADVQDSELTHFVVSTPLVGPIPHITAFFAEHHIPCYSLQGGMALEDMERSIKTWQSTGGAMIQSISFAESYELPPAENMYMLGYDYDPERNTQAEDRIHRDIRVTPNPVNIYYVKHDDAYDSKILEALAFHADNVYALLNKPPHELAEVFR